MRRINNFKQPLRTKLWISYILIFTIPLFLFSTIGYIWLSNNITDNSTRYYTNTLNEIVRETDKCVQQLNAVSNQLSQTAWVAKLINMQGTEIDSKRITTYDLFEYNQSISACMKSIDIIDMFGIYFPEKNLVISSTGNSTIDFILKDAFHIVNFDKDAFNKAVKELKMEKHEILFFDDIYVYGKHGKGALYLRSIRSKDSSIESGVVYAYIPESKIINNMKSVINNDEFISITIMDQEKELIEVSSYEKGEAIEITSISDVTGWKYKLLISTKSLLQDVAFMRNILLSIVAGLLLICIAITAIFSQHIYKPVKDLLMRFNRNGVNPDDEFIYINNSITRLIEEQEDLRCRIEDLIPAWVSCSIIDMLTGECDITAVQSKFQEFFTLSNRRFFNICILIRKLPSGLQLSVQPITRVRLILDQIQEDVQVYIAELIDQTILLVNYDDQEDFSSWIVKLLDLWPEIIIAVGEQVSDLSMIRESYEKADLVSKYRKVQTGYRVVRWEEDDSMQEGYYFPINMEMQLLLYLQTGNSQKACSLIKEIYQKNVQDSSSRRVYWYDLMEGIYKLLQKVADEAKIQLESPPIPLSIKDLLELAESICTSIDYGSKGRILILDKIVEFIDASIENKDLSLQYVAHKFNVSTSFVSKAFKEKTGVNFLNYINGKRIELSKELLHQGYDVSTVAQLVGYTNDVTFRRQFKSFAGMTPTSFRDQQRLADI